MNFFYGINNNIFKSKLQIPIFKNRDLKKSKLKLFKIYPENNQWVLKENIKKKWLFFVWKIGIMNNGHFLWQLIFNDFGNN